jgi:hypothetical protein
MIATRYMGVAGGKWPTPQRGHWFPRPEDVNSFRSTLAALCRDSINQTNNQTATAAAQVGTRYRLTVYQRDRSRRLENEAEAIALILSGLERVLGDVVAKSWSVEVLMHREDRAPCALARALQYTDVLLTPHGFQSMLLLLLPRPAILFEVFPYRYFKRGYGPLSKEYGVVHGGIMSPPTTQLARLLLHMVPTKMCFRFKHCRSMARGDNVRLTRRGADRLVSIVKEHIVSLGSGNEYRDYLKLAA